MERQQIFGLHVKLNESLDLQPASLVAEKRPKDKSASGNTHNKQPIRLSWHLFLQSECDTQHKSIDQKWTECLCVGAIPRQSVAPKRDVG
ncbi:unnamed protein product [Mesocestoides corti]|uniref:Uncharacterized protein n=1 Tax=Mesocestoides corti TaxID=53468 RepID=A0A0R3UBV3_MESCO|nr:unnamed protein product [Mesocestoides corti]